MRWVVEGGRTLLGDAFRDVHAALIADELAVNLIINMTVAHEFLRQAMHKFAELGSIGVPKIFVNPNPNTNQMKTKRHTTVRAQYAVYRGRCDVLHLSGGGRLQVCPPPESAQVRNQSRSQIWMTNLHRN